MDKIEFKYDIRKSDLALETLVNLTTIPKNIWDNSIQDRQIINFVKIIDEIINAYEIKEIDCNEIDFIFSHITTSQNNCESIKTQGLLDLREAILCEGSEIKNFLYDNEIEINLKDKTLTYKNNKFDITFEKKAIELGSKESLAYRIGYKFYHDYNVCGFLTLDDRPYLGAVHKRPEILSDIDQLLNLNLSKEWINRTKAFEVIAKVRGSDVEDEVNNNKRWRCYLEKALAVACCGPSENIILLKKDKRVQKENILEINPFSKWSR